MSEVLTRLGAHAAWRWMFAAHAALGEAREAIDALNVFPVPDGDTGTNMFLTLDRAMEALLAKGSVHIDSPLSTALTEFTHETLLAARGNSGVLLSQLLRGAAEVVREHPDVDVDGIGGEHLAQSFDRGRVRARQAVGRPVEGTILTVADALADAALAAAAAGGTLAEVSYAALSGAQQALADTPRRLPLLAAAGVVDAGGAGLVLVYAMLHQTITGQPVDAAIPSLAQAGEPGRASVAGPGAGDAGHAAPGTDTLAGALAAYEVMYVLTGLAEARHENLRLALGAIGDSVVVVGDEVVTTVHVHTRDAGAAVEAGYPFGRPERLRITWLAGPVPGVGEGIEALLSPYTSTTSLAARGRPRSAVLACAPGPRLGGVMSDAGAWVVASAPGHRATTGDLLAARREIPAESVVLLANHDDTVMAAQLAERLARAEGLPTTVVPTRAAVAGLAALAVHEPSATSEANAELMTAAAQACRVGSLRTAVRDATTAAGPCRAGDLVAYVDREAVSIGLDPDEQADALLAALLTDASELVTIVEGAEHRDDTDTPLAARLARRLRAAHPGLEVTLVPGDPGGYSLLVGVE